MFTQFNAEIHHPQFWVALTKIIWINVLLSGDNALLVALACRGLAPRQRLWGMILGAAAAVILLIIFTAIVATVMELPYLKLAGGLALIIIAAKLMVPEGGDERGVKPAPHLWAAVQIVVVADIVMSLDNVIAVAAAAGGSVPLLILGLASSIPLIVAGAALIMALLDRLPMLLWAGSALLAGSPATSSRPILLFTRSCSAFAMAPSASNLTRCWRCGGGAAVCRRRKRRRNCLRDSGRLHRIGRRIDLAQAQAFARWTGNLALPPISSPRWRPSAARSIRCGRPAVPAA